MATLKAKVDLDVCLGTGQCYYLHKEQFQERDDGRSEPVKDSYDESEREALEDAADLCPVSAITIVEE